MGHVIHSHALSIFVLQGPDLVMGLDADPAVRNVVGMVRANPELAKLALGSIVRDVCALRGMETGGAVCRLFHAYLDGVMDGLLYRPVKSDIVSTGAICQIELETR